MPTEQLETLLAFFKALADETRLKLLGLLAVRECTVQEIATTLEVKEPTVSHHLSKLKELNLVLLRAEGTERYYRLNSDALRAISKDVLSPEKLAEATAPDLDPDKFRTKVLRTFVENGRLKQIPLQRKKREVILGWLVERFEPGRRYPEPEVNAVIKAVHEDTATLRRELIMTGLMKRSDGVPGSHSVYWR